MTEKSLSEKRFESFGVGAYYEDDVKEFVKKLKEEIRNVNWIGRGSHAKMRENICEIIEKEFHGEEK